MHISYKLRTKNHKLFKGQAALSLVFLIGGISLFVAVTISLVAVSFLNSVFAFRSANIAMAGAMSGAEDALMRLARDNSFSSVGGYTVPSGCVAGCPTVTVTQGSGQVIIISMATISLSTRKVRVVASVDQNTGQVSVASWTSITF